MIVKEQIGNLIKTYSDRGMLIRGGVPEGLYAEAVDPAEFNREYEETDIPIPEDKEPEEEIVEGE